MTRIDFKFILDLKDYQRDSNWCEKGVVFHRFLPNNEKDKVEKTIAHINGEISFWFERRLKLVNKEGPTGEKVFYDYNSRLEDENIITKQSHIGNEALFGSLYIQNPPKAAVVAIENNEIENKEYIAFGKKSLIQYIHIPSN